MLAWDPMLVDQPLPRRIRTNNLNKIASVVHSKNKSLAPTHSTFNGGRSIDLTRNRHIRAMHGSGDRGHMDWRRRNLTRAQNSKTASCKCQKQSQTAKNSSAGWLGCIAKWTDANHSHIAITSRARGVSQDGHRYRLVGCLHDNLPTISSSTSSSVTNPTTSCWTLTTRLIGWR